jgi:hypothetical protein
MRSPGQGRKRPGFMEPNLYLIVMVGVIVVVTLAIAPGLFTKKCPACGARNGLDARSCRKCGGAFPDEGAEE